jgi:hypothetical protein
MISDGSATILRTNAWYITAALLDRSNGRRSTGFNRNDYAYAITNFGIVDNMTNDKLVYWIGVLYKYRDQIRNFSRKTLFEILSESE